MKSVIKGIGVYLPERELTSTEVETMAHFEDFGIKHGFCKMLTGCETRRYAAENEFSSDIATKASLEAMENAKVTPDEIDALIFCSVTQDFAEPATSNIVACNLHLKNAFCFDIKNACNAFISGMDIADSLIKTNKAKTVLVVSGEALSKWVKYDYTNKNELMNRAPVTLSIGDGGGAFVIQSEENTERGIQSAVFRTFPELWNNNVVLGGGVRYPHDPEKMYIPGTTKAIIDHQLNNSEELLQLIYDKTGWTFNDIDCFIPTQVAKWIVNSLIKSTSIEPEKVVQVVQKYGNVGASNIPIATYEAWKKGLLKEGTKSLMTGVGVGISFGSIAVVW